MGRRGGASIAVAAADDSRIANRRFYPSLGLALKPFRLGRVPKQQVVPLEVEMNPWPIWSVVWASMVMVIPRGEDEIRLSTSSHPSP